MNIQNTEIGSGGLPFVALRNEQAEAEIYRHGAHLARWKPRGASEVLWLSRESLWHSDKPIRGGVPICFPWFGPNAHDATAPPHGWARTSQWSLVEADDESATMELEQGDWQLQFRVVAGSELEMAMEIRNRSAHTRQCEIALHTYFCVEDIAQVGVAGLQGAPFIDKTRAMEQRTQNESVLKIEGETDRIYNSRETIEILDEAMKRKIVVEKSGSGATVVWNPGPKKAAAMPDFGDDEWTKMICVETANVADCALELAPNGTHIMTARVRIERI